MLIRLAFALSLSTLVLPEATAQETATPDKFQASRYLPANYDTVAYADFATMRDIEFWGAIERSTVGMMLGAFEQEFGFGLGELEEIFTVPGDPDERGNRMQTLTVMHGGDAVGVPSTVEGDEIEIGSTTAMQRKTPWSPGTGDLYYSPREGVLVMGDPTMLKPLLEKEEHRGVPVPNVLAFTAHPNNVAYVVMSPNEAELRSNPLLSMVLPQTEGIDWKGEKDAIECVGFRLSYDQDADAMVMHMDARFETGTVNAEPFEKNLRDLLDQAKQHPRLAAMKALWNKVEIARDGAVVAATLPLGTARQAGAQFAMVAPLMFMSAVSTEAPIAAPVPVAAPKGNGKK